MRNLLNSYTHRTGSLVALKGTPDVTTIVPASFDPSSWLLIDPTSRADLIVYRDVLTRISNGKANEVASSLYKSSLERLRARWHEQHHYFQYACTPFGMLLSRIHLIRTASAAVVMAKELRSEGTLTPLHRLIYSSLQDIPRNQWLESNVPTEQFHFKRRIWMDDLSWMSLERWNAAVDVEAMILGTNGPRQYFEKQWSLLFENFPPVTLLDRSEPHYLASVITDIPDEGTSPHGTTTGEEFLEGAAKAAEILAVQKGFGFEATMGLFEGASGPGFYWRTVANAANQLGLPPQDPLVHVLHDLALHQFPDPEATGGQGGEISWTKYHPGHFFDRALVTLSDLRIPSHLPTSSAYDFLVAALKLPDDSPYRRFQLWSRQLPTVEELLHQRDALTREVSPETLSGSGPLIEFQVLTFKAAARLRSEDVTVFTYDYSECAERVWEQRMQITMQPFILSAETLDTYPSINGDPVEHFWMLRDMLGRLILDELATKGRLSRSKRLVEVVELQNGRDYVNMIIDCLAAGLGRSLGDYLKARLAFKGRAQ